MFHKLLTGAVLALCMLGGALSAHAENIRLAVTDLVGLEELQREFGPFKSELERVSGLGIDFLPVTNRTAALEALRFKKVDFVLAGPAEYVVMQKRANASVVAGLYRPDYYSLIVVKADSPIFSVRELKGKRVGMGPVGSTSRHLGPIQLLADSGLDPLKDTGITNTNLRLAWEGLKKGDLEAVGMGRSDLEKLPVERSAGTAERLPHPGARRRPSERPADGGRACAGPNHRETAHSHRRQLRSPGRQHRAGCRTCEALPGHAFSDHDRGQGLRHRALHVSHRRLSRIFGIHR
ncbi:PhnD/SsuA/transferrin family substrate-binding protein [Azotobacter vinelandii]